MNAGALGIEVIISGKIPGARAKSWRFYTGYLKKCGDVALSVKAAKKSALLKSGIIGVKVAIMPPDIVLPDKINLLEEPEQIVAPVKKEIAPAKAPAKKKRTTTKKPAKKEAEPAKEESSEATAAEETAEATEDKTAEVSDS